MESHMEILFYEKFLYCNDINVDFQFVIKELQ